MTFKSTQLYEAILGKERFEEDCLCSHFQHRLTRSAAIRNDLNIFVTNNLIHTVKEIPQIYRWTRIRGSNTQNS